jgi:alpha-glucan,water dikinase
MSKYWDHLKRNGIDGARLASYERKITFEPYMVHNCIPDFENYLRILKSVHSSDDLNMLIDEAKRHVGGDVHHLMSDL